MAAGRDDRGRVRQTGGTGAAAGRGRGLGFAPGQVLSGPVDLRLRASLVGTRIHYLASVDSTNATLRSLADGGESEGTVVVSDEQTAGRGRAGRSWFSPPGQGLWLSVLLRPGMPARELAPLSMVTAISVATAAREATGADVGVKWPNDIVAGGRKLGGILLESLQGAGGSVERMVVGVGLNVSLEAGELPANLRQTATSLRMLSGGPVSRLDVLRAVLDGFDEDWRSFEEEGFGSFRERWRELSTVLGRRIEIASDSGSAAGAPGPNGGRSAPAPSGTLPESRRITGKAVGLSPDGALVVENDAGQRSEVWHGDVVGLW